MNKFFFIVTSALSERELAPLLTAKQSAGMWFGEHNIIGGGHSFMVHAGTDSRHAEERQTYHEFLRVSFPPGSLVEWMYMRLGPDTAILDLSDTPRRRVFDDPTATVDEGAELAKYFLDNKAPPTDQLMAYLRKRQPHADDPVFQRPDDEGWSTTPVYDDRIDLARRVYNRGLNVSTPLAELYSQLGEVLACEDWRDRLLQSVRGAEHTVLDQADQIYRAEESLKQCLEERFMLIVLTCALARRLGWEVRFAANAARNGMSDVTVSVLLPQRPFQRPELASWSAVATLHNFQAYPSVMQFLTRLPQGGIAHDPQKTRSVLLAFLEQETP